MGITTIPKGGRSWCPSTTYITRLFSLLVLGEPTAVFSQEDSLPDFFQILSNEHSLSLASAMFGIRCSGIPCFRGPQYPRVDFDPAPWLKIRTSCLMS